MNRRLGCGLVALQLMAGVVACSSSSAPQSAAGLATSLSSHLDRLPASLIAESAGAPLFLTWSDVIRAAEVAKRPRPATAAERVKWFGDLNMASPNDANGIVLARTALASRADVEGIAAIAEEIGVPPSELTSWLDVERPPTSTTSFTATIERQALTSKMGEPTDSMWSIGPTEDFVPDVKGRSALRRVGAGLRFGAVAEGFVMSTSTPVVRAAIDASGPSLLDTEPLKSIAAALTTSDMYSVAVIVGPSSPRPNLDGLDADQVAELTEKLNASALSPVTAIAVAMSADRKASVIYVHELETAAVDNESKLAKAFAEGRSMVSNVALTELYTVSSIKRSGTTVTVEISMNADRHSAAFEALFAGDIPFTAA
jgi:hypothetical protein